MNVFYPTNAFYRKMRTFLITTKQGSILYANHHEMSAIVDELSIGDVWVELTYYKNAELTYQRLDWTPPDTTSGFDKLVLTNPGIH